LAPTFRQRFYWLRDGFRGEPRSVVLRLGRALRRRLPSVNGSVRANEHCDNLFAAHGKAAGRHKAKRFGGTLALFRSDESSSKLKHTPKLGWDALARDVQVHSVSSPHIDMLSNPAAVQFIAEALQDYSSAQRQG